MVTIVALRQEYWLPPCCKENTRVTEAAIDRKAPRRSVLLDASLNINRLNVTAGSEFKFGNAIGITIATKMNAVAPRGALFSLSVAELTPRPFKENSNSLHEKYPSPRSVTGDDPTKDRTYYICDDEDRS